MTIEQWQPESESGDNAIDFSIVEWLISQISDSSQEQILLLVQQLEIDQQQALTPLMQLKQELWIERYRQLNATQCKNLIFFFTAAESAYAALTANEHSPAIAFNQLLKTMQQKLSQQELLWIRSNSQNRYIPNGKIF